MSTNLFVDFSTYPRARAHHFFKVLNEHSTIVVARLSRRVATKKEERIGQEGKKKKETLIIHPSRNFGAVIRRDERPYQTPPVSHQGARCFLALECFITTGGNGARLADSSVDPSVRLLFVFQRIIAWDFPFRRKIIFNARLYLCLFSLFSWGGGVVLGKVGFPLLGANHLIPGVSVSRPSICIKHVKVRPSVTANKKGEGEKSLLRCCCAQGAEPS